MIGSIAARIEEHAAHWARRRQGADALSTTLSRRRIYILPSRFGIAFGLLVFAMLLGSLNYNASLGFALTFLLAGLGLVAMHHCHGNLLGTHVRFSGAGPVFAGERCEFRFALSNDARLPRYDLTLAQRRRETAPVDLAPGDTVELSLAVSSAERGWLRLGRFTIATRHPGNLFRAWSWLEMNASCLIYPALAAPGRAPPASASSAGTKTTTARGDADFAGLRKAAPGDPPHRIAWKAYARSNQLLVKDFAAAADSPQIFAWDSLPDLDAEARLSQLARWCVDAASEGRSVGLELPGIRITIGTGTAHLHECLKALAVYETPSMP